MLIILNHKMNLNINEIKEYEKALRDYDVVVMPQTPYMGLFTNGKYILGSQCISEYTATGGVSAESLVHLNVKYVLVGHYERRSIERDTDQVIREKIIEIINNDMTPILCIGDDTILKEQINNVFDYINVDLNKIVIAYEPNYNIGTDRTLQPKEIKEKVSYIKDYLKDKYSLNNKVLYGGSINQNNINSIKDINNIDGVLIGAASLDINEVITIYNQICN